MKEWTEGEKEEIKRMAYNYYNLRRQYQLDGNELGDWLYAEGIFNIMNKKHKIRGSD